MGSAKVSSKRGTRASTPSCSPRRTTLPPVPLTRPCRLSGSGCSPSGTVKKAICRLARSAARLGARSAPIGTGHALAVAQEEDQLLACVGLGKAGEGIAETLLEVDGSGRILLLEFLESVVEFAGRLEAPGEIVFACIDGPEGDAVVGVEFGEEVVGDLDGQCAEVLGPCWPRCRSG